MGLKSIVERYVAAKRAYLLAQSDSEIDLDRLEEIISNDLRAVAVLFHRNEADWDLELYLTDQIRIYNSMAEMYSPKLRERFRYKKNEAKTRYLP